MAKKNLPVKIINKRVKVDDRRVEGMNGDELPSFVLKGEQLKIKASIIKKNFKNTKVTAQGLFKKYEDLPIVLKAKINDDALAKSYREDLVSFITKNQYNVIGFSENEEIIIRVDTAKELDYIEENIENYLYNPIQISGIDYIDVSNPIIEVENLCQNNIFKLRFQDFNDKNTNNHIEDVFLKLIRDKKINFIDKAQYTEDLVIYKISCDSIEDLKALADFTPVKSIVSMPKYKIFQDSFFTDNVMEFPTPNPEVSYPTVGILDSGLDRFTQLGPWILNKKHTSYPNEYLNPAHGTFVGGIVAFADILEDKEHTGVNGCMLFDASVYPDQNRESIDEFDLINNIKETMESYGEHIKVWNLSLGSREECNKNDFSEFGMFLDSIQTEYNILIIKSAGNCDNFTKKKPISRISRGADSIKAITVGSISHNKNMEDLSDIFHASPFSRIGPGPASIIKPELVHFGGNAGIDSRGKILPNGVVSIGGNGSLIKNIGTSFSTPRVSAIAADLANQLNEDFDPLLIKALLIHSANYPIQVNLDINDKLNEYGFGIPKTASDILYNDEDEITLILRDSITKGEYTEITDFPFAKSLIDENGFYDAQIFLTVVNDPVIHEHSASEYCQSDIEIKFGTYGKKILRDTKKPRILNEIGIEGNKNLLTDSIYSRKKSTEDKRVFANTEKMKVKYRDKFYPVKKYVVDLTEITTSNKEKYTEAPKKWYLRIKGLFRKYSEMKSVRERTSLTQEYCLILTIRDSKKRGVVYQEISEQLDINNFVHRDIRIRQDLNVQVEE